MSGSGYDALVRPNAARPPSGLSAVVVSVELYGDCVASVAMSCHVVPPSVEISITPPSQYVFDEYSNENVWLNVIVTGVVASAVSGGDVTLESLRAPLSTPSHVPSSPVGRACDQALSIASTVQGEPIASNESVAELAGTSSVLTVTARSCSTVSVQPSSAVSV